MSSTIKIGVLGAGNFANNQHLPNLAKIDCAEVVAIADVNAEAVAATAAKFGIPRTYAHGHAMLENEDLDAMWSIVPAYTRTDVEATAAGKGIHLFSEKPQAIKLEVAQRIDDAIAKSGVLSTVCFRERYRPIFMEAKRLLQDKKIVHLRFQSVGGLPNADPGEGWSGHLEKGGTSWFDWGPHAVDYCRYMSGLDVSTVQCFFHHPEEYPIPLSAAFNFVMSSGATMSLSYIAASPAKPPEEPYFLIYYEGGYLGVHSYDHIDMNGERVFEGSEYNPWFELDRRFAEAVLNGDGSELLNDYHDGLYSLAPILAGWESARRGGEIIDLAEFMARGRR